MYVCMYVCGTRVRRRVHVYYYSTRVRTGTRIYRYSYSYTILVLESFVAHAHAFYYKSTWSAPIQVPPVSGKPTDHSIRSPTNCVGICFRTFYGRARC